MIDALELSCLITLSYFAQFKRALSAEELHSLLWQNRASLKEMSEAVKRLEAKGSVVVESNLIGLDQTTVITSLRREELLKARRAAALDIAKRIQEVPGVASVILMNSTAMQTLREKSDIDFLIITEPNHLYTSRFYTLLQLKTKGIMKTSGDEAGKACLGYWLAEDDLSVAAYQTEWHTAAYWIATMVPLAGHESYVKFINANNWVRQFLPNWHMHEVAHLPEIESRQSTLAVAERSLFWAQKQKILADPEFRRSTELVVEPNRLKLHSVDKRIGYGQKMERILDILLSRG